jgi:hypothetical protein
MRFHDKAVWCLGAAAGVLSACNNTPQAPPPTTTDLLVTETLLESYDAAWGFVVADPINESTLFPTAPATFNPADGAAQAAAGAAVNFSPAGCVQATASGDVATYIFTDCAVGPLSLTDISGKVTATYSNGANGPEVQIGSVNLVVGGDSLDLTATGTIGQSGNQRTLALTSQTVNGSLSSGSRSFTETLSWTQGTPCLMMNGTGTQAASGTTTHVTVTNTQQCSAQCPRAGSVAATGPAVTSTVNFNGTATVTAVESNGTTSNVTLTCP